MQTNQMKISELNASDILNWIKEHPNFLNDCPEACDILIPPENKQGKGVVDFQSFMVKKLKNDKEEIISTAKDIVETSRANMQNQARIQEAVLRIIETENFDDFTQTITMDLTSILHVDITSLVIETNSHKIPHINNSGVKLVPNGTINRWLGKSHHLLEENIKGIEEIYGGGATLVASQALFRIDTNDNNPPSLLAFGSRNPHCFKQGMATDQINFLTRVIEKTLSRIINE